MGEGVRPSSSPSLPPTLPPRRAPNVVASGCTPFHGTRHLKLLQGKRCIHHLSTPRQAHGRKFLLGTSSKGCSLFARLDCLYFHLLSIFCSCARESPRPNKRAHILIIWVSANWNDLPRPRPRALLVKKCWIIR